MPAPPGQQEPEVVGRRQQRARRATRSRRAAARARCGCRRPARCRSAPSCLPRPSPGRRPTSPRTAGRSAPRSRRSSASRRGSAPRRAGSWCARRARRHASFPAASTSTAGRPPRGSAARPCRRASPTTGPGSRPRISATIPVFAMPSWISSTPISRSRAATKAAVSKRSKSSSGMVCRCRRHARSSGSNSAIRLMTGHQSAQSAVQRKGHRLERRDAHLGVVPQARDQRPAAALQREGLERPRQRVDQPEVPDAGLAVDRALVGQVDPARAGAQHLADPVRHQLEPGRVRQRRHPLQAPAAEIGHQHVVTQMQLRLDEDPPAARPASAAAERSRSAPPGGSNAHAHAAAPGAAAGAARRGRSPPPCWAARRSRPDRSRAGGPSRGRSCLGR